MNDEAPKSALTQPSEDLRQAPLRPSDTNLWPDKGEDARPCPYEWEHSAPAGAITENISTVGRGFSKGAR